MSSSTFTPGYLDKFLHFTANDDPLVDFATLKIQAGGDDKPRRVVDLPTDIVQLILTFAMAPIHDDPDLVDLRMSQTTVTSGAQVCGAWRVAALAQKELWAAIVDFQAQSIPRLRHLLKISAPYPFNVGHRSAPVSFTGAVADPRSRNILPLLRLLQEHQARVREFHVDWFSANKAFVVDGRAVTLSQLQMPRLEVLTWCGGGPVDSLSSPMEQDGSDSLAFPIFPALPCLRRIVLHYSFGISDPLLSRCCATLTELSLFHPSPAHRMSIQQLANVLMTLGLLELLTLYNALESSDGGPAAVTPNLPPISLPHLVYMSFGAPRPARMDPLITLLGAISPATNCGVDLMLPYMFLIDPFRQPLLDCLVRLFDSPIHSQQREMKVYMSLDHGGPQGHCSLSNVSPRRLDSLTLEHNGRQSALRSLASLKIRPLTVQCRSGFHALHCMSHIWREVSSLEISSQGVIDPLSTLLSYVGAYSTFMNVVNLTLHKGAAEDGLRNITPHKGQGDHCLPKLENITLVSCRCTPESDLFQVLVQTLAERQSSMEIPIRELCFTQCVVSKDDLRDIARLFECDITIAPGHFDSSQAAHYERYCSRHEVL